jgi:hypothetical protein
MRIHSSFKGAPAGAGTTGSKGNSKSGGGAGAGGGANLYRIASPSSSQKRVRDGDSMAAVVADPLKRSKEDLNAETYGTLVSMCNRFMSRPPVYKRGLVQAILEHQDIEKVEREKRKGTESVVCHKRLWIKQFCYR